MKTNRVQLQADMTPDRIPAEYGAEQQRRRQGLREHYLEVSQCRDCRCQTRSTEGTTFHSTKRPPATRLRPPVKPP